MGNIDIALTRKLVRVIFRNIRALTDIYIVYLSLYIYILQLSTNKIPICEDFNSFLET